MKKLRINAVYIKELNQMVRNPNLPLAIAVYLIILSSLGVATLTGIFSGQDNFTSLKNSFIILYKMVLGFEFGLLIFMMPQITAGSISSEREGRTLDMMLATTMNTYKIVLGKLLSAISKIMLYAVASLPVIGLVFVVGVIDFHSIIQFFGVLIVTSFFIGSFGILMSVLLTRSTTATIMTYAVVILVLSGTIFAVFLDDIFLGNRNTLDMFDTFLLINPITTIYVMMSDQLGMIGEGLEIIVAVNEGENFVLNHWVAMSLFLQTAIGVINFVLSGYFLNPLRKK